MEALSKTQLLTWSKPLPPYNTFIGGAGISYPTASALSTAMSLPPEAIQRFAVDDKNTISCRIDRNYTIVGNAFDYTTSYKDFFIDLDARMIGVTWIRAMARVPNLKLRLLGLLNYYNAFNEITSPNIFFLPECTVGQGSVFKDWFNGINRLYIPKITSFEAAAGANAQFQSFNTNPIGKKNVIYINSAISGNSGLLTAVTKGATVRIVTNYDTPNKVTDLTASETYARTVKLTFTTPTAGTNPIDFYEVWFQKLGSFNPERRFLPSDSEIKNSNDYVFNLEPNTQYSMYICTVDTMYNGSGMFKDEIKRAVSNEISFATPALSAYQIGMSAYWKLNANSFDFNGLNRSGVDTSMTYASGYAKFGTGYVDIADNDAFSFTDGTNDISAHIAIGFIWNDKTGIQFFISKRNGTASGAEWDVVLNAGLLRFQLSNPTSLTNAIKIEIPVASITAGVLNTLQYSYDGSKNHTGLKAYLNGISIGTSSLIGTYTGQVNGNSQVRIGREIYGSSFYWKADAKDIAIWKNRTMSPTEITEIDYRIKNNIPLI